MKLIDLNEWGRIVKGVNTTPDVDTDEIKVQTAKFGNTVDKDGKPPTLSKKVKGSKTNVLFNLGLAEGIILRLERDKHMDVLHVMDTKEKHRVEVRGKKGYESGNYDPQDKLHQVLDSVGKAANISELINGETVSINPNHPQGTRAIRTAQDVLQTEDKFTPMQLALMEGGHSIEDWVCGKCYADPCICESVEVNEKWSQKYKRSINCNNPKGFSQKAHCAGRKKNESVADWFKRTFNPDPQFKAWLRMYKVDPKKAQATFGNTKHKEYLASMLTQVDENFADGKKKGKSRPGRVKRSGASCNGSVTALRKRAKNASGEKARMYHWCANMKSGRKKK